MAHTRNWVNTDPITHSKLKTIPGEVRDLKVDIEERLAVFFYGFTSGETSDGIKYLPFWVQTTAPTGAPNKICMYAKISNSKAALKVKTQDDVEIRIIERNWGILDDFALSNNVNLRARNAGDNGFIDILKVNAFDKPEFYSIPVLPGSNPTTDNEACRKAYVDGKTWDHGSQLTGLTDHDHLQYARGQVNNVKIAYGLTTLNGIGGATVTLPFSFADTNYAVAIAVDYAVNDYVSVNIRSKTTYSFVIYNYYNQTVVANWIAIGVA